MSAPEITATELTTSQRDHLIARLRLWLAPATDDEARCAICGWPLESSTAHGCVRGNCSSRPLPRRWYATERAKREYGPSLQEPENLAPLTFNLSGDDVRLVLALLDAREAQTRHTVRVGANDPPSAPPSADAREEQTPLDAETEHAMHLAWRKRAEEAERREMGLPGFLPDGWRPLNAEQQAKMVEFRQHMNDVVIPQIIEDVRQRHEAAARSRHQILSASADAREETRPTIWGGAMPTPFDETPTPTPHDSREETRQQPLSDLDKAELGVYLGLSPELQRSYSTPDDVDAAPTPHDEPETPR